MTIERKRKNNGRVRGKPLAASPVVDLNSEKKDELLNDIFNKKAAQPVAVADRMPLQISKLEKVALPVLVVAAVIVGWSIVFNLFFYKTNIDFKNEAKTSAVAFLQAVAQSISYLKSDFSVVANAPSLNLVAGIGVLGDRIADVAEKGSIKTISIVNGIK